MKKLFTTFTLLAIIGFSANAQTAYITNAGDSTVSVINVATNTISATIPVGSNSAGVSVSPDGTKVYVANCGNNTVSVIKTATNTVSAIIAVGTNPAGVSVSPDGTKVYVTNMYDNTVSVINTATNTVSATITVGIYPHGVSVSPDGSKVYVANYSAHTVSVINTATNTISATIPVGSNPEGVSVSPDGSKVYVANFTDNSVSVINTATNTVSAIIMYVGIHPIGISVSPDGLRVYVANAGDNTVIVINTATNTVSATITVGTNFYPMGISVSPDGTKVYVANYNDGTVSVINTATNTVLATITVGSYPAAFGNFISTHEQPTTTQTNISCYGSNNGTAIVNSVNNGTPPYTYLWNTVPPQTTNTATGLVAGNYTVTITDFNGTEYSISFTITQPSAINILISGNTIICKGDSTTICISATDGVSPYTYLWSNGSITSCQLVFPVNTESYSATVTDYIGCIAISSIHTVTLDSASKPIITQNGNMLFSTAASSYQWYLNGNPINGATGQFYAPLVSGVYSVTIIAANGCSATSDTISVVVGINEISNQLNISVFPNPANDNITIESPQKAVIEISDIQGQLIKTIVVSNNKTNIDVSVLTSGVYFIKVKTEKGVVVEKFVKE